LYGHHPELSTSRGRLPPISSDDISHLLPYGTSALVEFTVTRDRTYMFVATRTAAAAATLKSYGIDIKKEELGRQVEDFRSKLASGSLDLRRPSAALFELLLAP